MKVLLKLILIVYLGALSSVSYARRANDIKIGEPGSSSSKKATIVTSYDSAKTAMDSVLVTLKHQGYKITSIGRTKVKGFKPVNFPASKCHCDESSNCSEEGNVKRVCKCQSKQNLFSLLAPNVQKTPTIKAEIQSSRKEVKILLSTRLKAKRIEPPTDIESISKSLDSKEVLLQ